MADFKDLATPTRLAKLEGMGLIERLPEQSPESDLRAAKDRLGAWCAEEPSRWWDRVEPHRGDHMIVLWTDGGVRESGHGPTEAAAILAALEKVNGG